MTTKTDNLQDRIGDLLMELAERSAADALSIATGVFVSLTLSAMRSAGHDDSEEIRIDGGENRDITIHAAKVKL